jgi:RHS repeat-associated protein
MSNKFAYLRIGLVIFLSWFPATIGAEVLHDGGFTNRYQIKLPIANAGLMPQLALEYNTRSPGNLISPGFEISGLMRIERISLGQGIRYKGNDIYSGPHGKLVDLSGNRTIFHSETESFTRYQPNYGTCGALPTEPCSWIVTTSDGVKFYFGTNSESVAWYESDAWQTSGNAIRYWLLNRVEDLHGNYYTLRYSDYDGEPYINSIVYTAGAGVTRYRLISFGYENRADYANTYGDGGKSSNRKRLSEISVRSNALCTDYGHMIGGCTAGDLVRRYKFTYDYSPVTGRSRLIKLQEFGSNSIDAKPPEIFSYENNSMGDTLLKVPKLDTTNFGALHYGQIQYYGTLQYPDLNGDGRPDVCVRDPYSGIVCSLSNGSGFSSTIWGPTLSDTEGYIQARYYSTIRYPDVNGDGKADICYRNAWGITCAIGTGSSFTDYFTGPAFTDSSGYDQSQYLRTLQYPDVNGDGKADICIRDANGIECRLSTGSGFGAPFRGPAWTDAIGFTNAKYYSTITYIDINGDGKADVCVRNSTGIICHLSFGTGFEQAAVAGPAWTDAIGFDQPIYYSSIRYTDLNRDGKVDICARVSGGIDCYYGTGTSFAPAFTSAVFADSTGFNTQNHVYSLQFIDLNRDGIPEVCGRKSDGLYCYRGTGRDFGDVYFSSILSDANGFNQDSQPYIFVDHNADGVLDLCYAKVSGTVDCFVSESLYADSLVSVQAASGSLTKLLYTTIAQESAGIPVSAPHSVPFRGNANTNLLVKRVLVSDGRGHEYATRYDYEGALIKWGTPEEIEDLGFRKIRETNETTGQYKQTFFYQNISDGLSGAHHIRHARKIELEHEYTGAGVFIRNMRNEYYDDDTTIFAGTRLSRLKAQYYMTNNGPVNVKTFGYDSYGNILNILDRFDPTELIATLNTYDYDTVRNIFSRKTSEKQLWDTTKNDQLLANGQFYDPNNDDKIIKWTKWTYVLDNLIREEKYLDTLNDFIAVHYSYDTAGRKIGVTSPRGVSAGDPAFTTTLSYDSQYQAQPISVTNPLGQTVTKELDNFGINVAKETDANGNSQIKKYDVFGELKEIVEPGDDWTKRIKFSSLGDPVNQYMEVQYRQGATLDYRFERSYFDGLKRVYRVEKTGWNDGSQNYTIITDTEFYDRTENVFKKSLPYVTGQVPAFTVFEYDNAGRLAKKTNPDNTAATTSVSAGSSTVLQENGKIRLIQYDARGRKKQILEQITGMDFATWASTNFTYGYLEQATTNPDGQIQRQKYDTLGRQISITENSKSYSFVFDNDDNIAYSTNPKGEVVHYTFDAQNRMTLKDAPGTDADVRYYYDAANHANGKGRATRIEDASGVTLLHYDAKGSIASWSKTMDSILFTFQASYDPEKRLEKIRYPDGDEVRYAYNKNGVLKQVLLKHNGAESPVVTYHGTETQGEFVRLTGNNVRDIGNYSLQVHKPTSLKTILPMTQSDSGESVIRDLTYQYDAMGNMAQIIDNLDQNYSQTFAYDGLKRMTAATGAYGSFNYVFSKGGKLLQKDGLTQSFSDSSNPQAVTDSDGVNYGYDTNGNMITRAADTFGYDAENRVISAHTGDGSSISFAYDFAGQRAIKRAPGLAIYYLSGLKNYGALYELTRRNGYLDAHTKYIYGIQSDRVAQVTRSDVNLSAMMNFNNHAVLASLDTKGIGNFLVKMSHMTNAWLMHPHLSRKVLWYLFILGCAIFVGLFAYSALRWQSDLQQRAPVFFYSIPLTVCVFFFFAGCGQNAGQSNNNGAWADLPSGTGAPPLGEGAQPVTGIYFYHPDHLGSTSFVTDAAGSVVTTLKYTPYGEIDTERSSGLDIARYKYTSQEEDAETGLYNYNARMYNPESGTFTTQDTIIPGDGDRSQGFNRYMYTEGNPVRWTDPTGHFIVESLLVGMTVLTICGARSGCPTTPFWHQFTGPKRRCVDLNCEPTTALDRISQRHDQKNAVLLGDSFDNLGENIDTQWKNMEADGTFIAQFTTNALSGALLMENFNRAQQQLEKDGWGKVGSWIGAIFVGIFYTVTDMMAGAMGVLLFMNNIIVNAIAVVFTGVIKFFKWLFGRDEPPCDATCQRQIQTAINTGPRINWQPSTP